MKYIRLLIILIIFYCYLYSPDFAFAGGLGAIKFLYLLIFLALLSYNNFFKILKKFRKLFTILSLILFYTLFRTAIGGAPSFIIAQTVSFIEVLILPASICFFLIRQNITFDYFIRCVLFTSVIASLISCLCIAVPGIGDFVRFNLQVINEEDYLYNNLFRGFGLSSGLTSTFGNIQAIIILFALSYDKHNKWFYIAIPFVIISIIFNSRTPIIILALGLLLKILYSRLSIRTLMSLAILICGVYFILPQLLTFFEVSDSSLYFITSFFDEMQGVVDEGNISGSTTATILFKRMIVLPTDIWGWIFGYGSDIFTATNGPRSDIGFIRQLYYGGLLYMSLLFTLVNYVFKNLKRYSTKTFAYSFLIVFFIANTKGLFLIDTGGFRLFVLVMMYMVLNEQNILKYEYKDNNTKDATRKCISK